MSGKSGRDLPFSGTRKTWMALFDFEGSAGIVGLVRYRVWLGGAIPSRQPASRGDSMAVVTPSAKPAEPKMTGDNRAFRPLENGDRLTRAEFERRYDAMPELNKAELIEGEVYMPSRVRYEQHGHPHTRLVTWLGNYETDTPGVEAGDNASIRLDLDNEPQPDAFLIIRPERGGQARISEDDYIEGAPELVAEVASSSAS